MSTMIIDNPIFGNRCEHNRREFRTYAIPKKHKKRPFILTQAIQNAAVYYRKPAKYLKELTLLNLTRKQRSERREAIGSVMQMILHYTDLATMRVGTPHQNGEINGLRLTFIAKKLGYSTKRVWRAIKDLKAAGYLEINYFVKKIVDNFYSIASIKLFNKTFHDLGISQLKLQTSKHYKNRSLEKRGYQGASYGERDTESTNAAKEALTKIKGLFSTNSRPASVTSHSPSRPHIDRDGFFRSAPKPTQPKVPLTAAQKHDKQRINELIYDTTRERNCDIIEAMAFLGIKSL